MHSLSSMNGTVARIINIDLIPGTKVNTEKTTKVNSVDFLKTLTASYHLTIIRIDLFSQID